MWFKTFSSFDQSVLSCGVAVSYLCHKIVLYCALDKQFRFPAQLLHSFKMVKAWFTLRHWHKKMKTKKNLPGGAFEDKNTAFFFIFSFVLTLLMLGLMSMSCADVDVLCHTLHVIPLCSPSCFANPYACVTV